MSRSFIDDLWMFATTIDFVDDAICDRINEQLSQFLLNTLKMDYYEVQIDGTWAQDGEQLKVPALTTFRTATRVWSNGEGIAIRIHGQRGEYSGHTTYAYDKNHKLWITGRDSKPLRKNDYEETWSNRRDLPRYWDYTKGDHRTSIIVPLTNDGVPFGFLNMESKLALTSTDRAKRQLSRLADAISSIIWSYRAHCFHHDNSKRAFSELESSSVFRRSFLEPATCFLAYSHRAEKDVMDTIKAMLGKRATQFTVVDWQKLDHPGDINSHIVAEIHRAAFGVLYFSEPAPGTDHKYKDNSNVVIEGAMFHALATFPAGPIAHWIPIREQDSPRLPFDFRSQRFLVVPRNKGALNKTEFKSQLERRIDAIASPH